MLKFNQARKAPRVRVFELGRVFLRNDAVQNTDTTVQGFDQPMRVAGLACGAADGLQWGRKETPVDFFDVKGDIEALLSPLKPEFVAATHPAMHPGRCAQVLLHGRAIGYVGELHPRWRQDYELLQNPVVFELDLDAVLQSRVAVFAAVPKLQPVQRDIAVMVTDAVSHQALMTSIHAAPTAGLLQEAQLFDVYRPKATATEGETAAPQRSLAVRLTLSSADATLTEEQIEHTVKAVLDQLDRDLGARQRA